MKERLLEFLKAENKSSAQLAEEIGVQPSGISHILSGRNNPSLDFVLKMLEKYKFLSSEWLLFGKGSMYRSDDGGMMTDTLFASELKFSEPVAYPAIDKKEVIDPEIIKQPVAGPDTGAIVEKIVWFYKDNTFREFSPSE